VRTPPIVVETSKLASTLGGSATVTAPFTVVA
jgi:hypothetical protein